MMQRLFGNNSITIDKTKPNLLFALGGPGTGKTTQCKLISQKLEFDYLLIDDLPLDRKSNKIKTQEKGLKQELQDLLLLFNQLLKDTRTKHEIILVEGFVLTVNDFIAWEQYTKEMINILGALYFHCPEETMKYRLFNREHNQIPNISEILLSLNSYQCEDKLLDYLEKEKIIISIETDDSIEFTFKRIIQNLKKNNIIKENIQVSKVININNTEWALVDPINYDLG